MDRPIIWMAEQGRSFDLTSFETDVLIAIGKAILAANGTNTTVVHGLVATQTTSPSLTINIGAGEIYEAASVDATAIGTIPQNLATIIQQGLAAAQTVVLSTSGIAGGQSRWSLIQCQFAQIDGVAPNDPNGGVPPFYNAANPEQPIYESVDTDRTAVCVIGVITGAAATTGSEVPPTPTAGWTPLYLIDLAFGQTTVTTGQIIQAGPSVGLNVPSNYPAMPVLAGLLNQHHLGVPGQAPKINLATETQGTLPSSAAAGQIQAQAGNYAADSGTANALVVTLSPVVTALSQLIGVPLRVLRTAANTTAATIAVNGLTATAIVHPDGTAMIAGDMPANAIAVVMYDGTNFELQTVASAYINSLALTKSQLQTGNYAAAGGTANALTLTLAPVPASQAALVGVPIRFLVGTTNTGSATLNVNGLGAQPLNHSDGTALIAGDMVAGAIVEFIWTGSQYIMQTTPLAYIASVPPHYASSQFGNTAGTNADVILCSKTLTVPVGGANYLVQAFVSQNVGTPGSASVKIILDASTVVGAAVDMTTEACGLASQVVTLTAGSHTLKCVWNGANGTYVAQQASISVALCQ